MADPAPDDRSGTSPDRAIESSQEFVAPPLYDVVGEQAAIAALRRAAAQRRRAAENRTSAADARALDAEDRRRSARDREQAASERRRALVDREALARRPLIAGTGEHAVNFVTDATAIELIAYADDR